MIFKVHHSKKMRDINPGMDAIYEFSQLTDNAMRYVCLMHDYDSPYSRLPITNREQHVLANLGVKDEKQAKIFKAKNFKSIEKAEKVLKEIQYDIEMEALIAYKVRVEGWIALIKKKNPTDAEQTILNKMGDLNSHLDKLNDLEKRVGYREANEATDEGSPKTALEKYLDAKKSSE